MTSKKKKKRKGTFELADRTTSIEKGCTLNCSYCYAKVIGNRFKWKLADDWHNPEPNEKRYHSIVKYYRKGIFCFSNHNVTPRNVDDCIDYIINRILKTSKNNVLIVSKFDPISMKKMCKAFKPYRERIEFMTTITTNSYKLLKRFEPNAPLSSKRIHSIRYAKNKGYKTSALIEPFLGPNPICLIKLIAPYCSYRIILGCFSKSNMRYYNYRYHKKDNLCKIIQDIKKLPKEIIYKIRLKNSFRDRLR